jgi:hypothetical protein
MESGSGFGDGDLSVSFGDKMAAGPPV